ncbi:capsular exopolysaccharide biosynthesis protein [Synechococcus sp. PCC 7502]|uniref:GumC family protein n=1 Tax=Synechococcus sp. PCC 7502 TaxID=1173263 RepID=UPI00029FDB51|nr:polysaccharide biosynthesis tyrosine autokinase [Synechococcus sp. PCC 7502]AFY74723.1 capsular exopolysaccharide biosynthesis protein [Synechococcus sp. PCC 7502]
MNQSPAEDKNPLFELLSIVRRYWFLEISIFSLVFGVSAFLTFQEKPIYQATGSLLFKSQRQSNTLTGVNSVAQISDTVAGDPRYTQLQVIRSTPVVAQTIKALALPLDNDVFLKPLSLDVIKYTDVIQVSYLSSSPQDAAKIVNGLMKSYIDNDLLTNREDTASARKFIDEQLPKLQISLRQAEAALRRFKEVNKAYLPEAEAQSAVAAVTSLDTQITASKSDLAKVNSEINDIRTRLGFTSEQAIILTKLSASKPVQETLSDLQKIDSQLVTLRATYTDNYPTITVLMEQRAPIQKLLQQRIKETLGTNELISDQDLQIGGAQLELITQLVTKEIERVGLEKQIATINDSFIEYQKRLVNIPKLEQQLLVLQRAVEISRTAYEGLLVKQQDIQLTEEQNIGNARILSPAVPSGVPISPKISNNLTTGAVLGIVAAISVALLLNSRDNLLRSGEDIKRLFGYPLLGILPNFATRKLENLPAFVLRNPESVLSKLYLKIRKSKAYRSFASSLESFKISILNAVSEPENTTALTVFVRDNPRAPASEAYRMLQTSLRFLNSDRQIKAIVITSSVPGEGKSTVSANLAVAIAQLGKRVLLVDVDMRRPSQHKIWGLGNASGLSNILVGETQLETVLESVVPNLDILSSGVLPPDPLTLIDSQHMTNLIGDWSRAYDYVILDTPPVLAVADAIVLGRIADGVLIVARPEVLDSGAAIRTRAILDQSELNILGLVINDVNSQDSAYYYQYHYYNTDKLLSASSEISV